MSLASVNFILLTAGAMVLYGLLPRRFRYLGLLTASLAFYLVSAQWGVLYLFSVIAVSYLGGLGLSRILSIPCPEGADKKEHRAFIKGRRHRVVALVCVLELGLLFVLKYWDFTAETVNGSLGTALPAFDLLMPLGLSFFIFQSIGYVVDVSRGKVQAQKNILKYALFVSFFPQMVQGPIGRYDALAPQLTAGEPLKAENFRNGVQLMMWGYFKKLLIAERCGSLVSAVFAAGETFPGAVSALAGLLYSVQLYADFSGGIDIIRGVAELFGVTMAENFRRPIFSGSLTEFWRRWHISLGSFLKDYLFYPLSLSKAFGRLGRFTRKHIPGTLGKIFPTTLATFIIYFVIGIWHGANYTYIAYGLYNGLIITSGLLLENTFRKIKTALCIDDKALWWRVFSVLRTLTVVYFGRFLTRAPYLKMSLVMIRNAVLDFHPSVLTWDYLSNLGFTAPDAVVIALSLAVLLTVEALQERGTRIREALSGKKPAVQFLFILLPLILILLLGVAGRDHVGSSFIYAQF